MRRFLILSHRYLGIPMSVMFVVWFISGIVMIYTRGFPALSEQDRLERAAVLDFSQVQVHANDAWARVQTFGPPAQVALTTVLARPAYRMTSYFGSQHTVFADNGELLEDISPVQAALVAGRYLELPAERLVFTDTLIDPDQWTLAQRGDLPLHRFNVDDENSSQVYVSVTTGEVALVTTRASRFFAWIGVIPHWLYFTPLRMNQPVWYWTVVGLSVLGCVLATLGLALAFTQFRRSRPFRLRKSVRYRGWKRWHYFSGALFGVFALTWVFSGLMSMEPFAWESAAGLEISPDAISGGELDLEAFPAILAANEAGTVLSNLSAAEVEYLRILGESYLAVSSPQRSRTLIHAATLVPASGPEPDRLIAAMNAAGYEAAVANAEQLDEYDAYYYSRDGEAPLPVLRVEYDDPLETWYYVSLADGRIVARTNRFRRIQRWLFNGLHSLDFPFWYDKRPLWDVGMIVLGLGALLTSAIGMFLGLRRMMSTRRRPAR